jgi:hypothetical protein
MDGVSVSKTVEGRLCRGAFARVGEKREKEISEFRATIVFSDARTTFRATVGREVAT